MRERAGRVGRHSAHSRGERRSVAPGGLDHCGGLRSRVSRRSAEPIAIIGGSVVGALVGRLRGGYAIADIESSTAELTTSTATTGRGGRARGSRPGRGAAGLAGGPPMGSARQRLRRRRQRLATLAIGTAAMVSVVAGGVAIAWPDPTPATSTPTAAASDDPDAIPEASVATADAGDLSSGDLSSGDLGPGDPSTGDPSLAGAGGLDQDSAGQNPMDSSLTARDTESYLDGLRTADIAVSDDGRAEREAGDAICEQLQRGVAEREIERALPAMLTTVGARQATTVVDLVQRYYCI